MLIKRPFEQPKFREGFALLERHGLLFECASWHNETPQLTALAKAFPGQTIVCDHVSTPLGWGPYKSEGATAVFEEWKVRSLCRLDPAAVPALLVCWPSGPCRFGTTHVAAMPVGWLIMAR